MTKAEEEKYAELVDQCEGDIEQAGRFWLQWKCLTDLYYLGAVVLGWGDTRDKTGRRRRLDPKFHGWLARTLQRDTDILLMLPRDHLKTTWTKARIAQLLLQNPNRRIGLFSQSPRVVRGSLRHIKSIFAQLHPIFPEIIPAPGKDYHGWEKSTDTQLTMKRDPELGYVPEDMPQITALGAGAKVTGLHLDWLFADDIISPETVTTQVQMEKSEEWWAYMQSILEPGAPTTMTGTFYHYNDLYNKIIKEGQFPKNAIFIRPAIENGEILYRTWFTHEMLDKIRKRQGSYIFSCLYLLNPVPREDQIFPPPQPVFAHLPKGEYAYYITVDPAPTTQAYSDETAIVVAAVDKIKTVYIVEANGYKKPGNEIAELLIRKVMQYKPVKVGIEFGLQENLRHIIDSRRSEIETLSGRSIGLNILPIPISNKMSKADRVNLTLGSFVRQGKVFIHESCRQLIQQMDAFTGKGKEQDDVVDAASMLFGIIDGFARNHWMEVRNYEDIMSLSWWVRKQKEQGWRQNFVA